MPIEYTILINDETIIQAAEGQNLLEILRNKNINITSPCAGKKNCGKCKVKMLKGEAPINDAELDLLSKEELKKGYRLACCINVFTDISIEIIEEGKLEVMTDGIDFSLDFDPLLKTHSCLKAESDKEDSISFLDYLYQDSFTNNIDLLSMQKISELTEKESISYITYDNKIIHCSEDPIDKLYGLAVDIGTTTVAVYLLDILTGEEIDVYSFHNPQKKFGADVISRINYTQVEGTVEELQQEIISGLNNAIFELSNKNNIHSDDIYLISAVGNTVMLHFLLGINSQSIASAPYRPVFTNSMVVPANLINLNINSKGVVQILPAVSSYLGADIVADLLVTDFESEDWNLLIDIGTNGEIILGNKQKLLACSTAAGPAFEGAKISHGVGGVPGAISKFQISNNNEFLYETIGSKDAIGICGSGLIDIVAEMLDKNILSSTGAFNNSIDDNFSKHLSTYKKMKALKITDLDSVSIDSPILISQKDIRELQLAKGAIAAGINILLKEAGIDYDDINKIYLAGGFGSFIDPKNACKIGLLPNKMENKIVKIGNGAGLGAKACLLDRKKLIEAELIVEKIEYIELSLRTDFQNEFMMSMEF